MITSVVGAPGSGKSTIRGPLAALLPGCVVLDWDAFMAAASMLAGRDIREREETWPAYRGLIRAVLEALAGPPVVLLGVCTPDELAGWPIDAWIVLDCSDEERTRRLAGCGRADITGEAIADAREYRGLGLPVLDTTDLAPDDVAANLARLIL